jgi:plasmid stability protein
MTTLHLNLPDDLRSRLEARAVESGFRSVEQYAEALLRASAAPGPTDESLERLLMARVEDDRPGIEFTPEFADEFRQQVRRLRASGGG